MQTAVSVTPVPLGLFTVPGREVAKYPGVTIRAPYVVCAYLIKAPGLTMLFDTGIVGDDEAVARFRPRYLDLADQLAVHAVELADVDVVVNCHLHADHAGGNHLFAGTPVLVQEAELAAAAAADYTVRSACVDYPGARFVKLRGRHQLSDLITVIPTPGHSPGHQSVVVRGSRDGVVLLAGQAFDSASEFAAAALARHLRAEAPDVAAPDWVDELLAADIDVAHFAHDLAQWRPGAGTFTGSSACRAWPSPE